MRSLLRLLYPRATTLCGVVLSLAGAWSLCSDVAVWCGAISIPLTLVGGIGFTSASACRPLGAVNGGSGTDFKVNMLVSALVCAFPIVSWADLCW